MSYPTGMSVIFGDDYVTVAIGTDIKTVKRGQEQFVKVMELLKEWSRGEWDNADEWTTALLDAFDPSRLVSSYIAGLKGTGVEFKNGRVFYKGREMNNVVTQRIRSLAREGLTITYLLKFLDNMYQNPSYRSVEQLYGFLEKHKMPITPDGKFKAYKVVNSNMKDCHTNTIDNSVGKTIRMARNRVEDNPNVTCSHGLHVCAHEYATGFFMGSGRVLLEVEVNPRDVVSIPTDYNNAKMRVCEYKVTGILKDTKDVLGNRVYSDSEARVEADEEYDLGDEYDTGWVQSFDEDDEDYDEYEDWDDEDYGDIPF